MGFLESVILEQILKELAEWGTWVWRGERTRRTHALEQRMSSKDGGVERV